MPSAAWKRRNAAARAKGYESYYDYRMHRYGQRPPEEERISGDEAEMLRGHRGRGSFAGILRRPERIALITELPYSVRGVWTHMQYTVVFTDASIRTYRVPVPDMEALQDWHDLIMENGIDFIEYKSKGTGAVAEAA